MRLSYDFQKWNIMTMLAIVTVCLAGMLKLVHGQENSTDTGLPSYEQFQYYMALNNIEVRKIFDYCFDHATDPNPVQDLIDKGVIDSQMYRDTTCAQIKILKDSFEKRLSETNITSIIK